MRTPIAPIFSSPDPRAGESADSPRRHTVVGADADHHLLHVAHVPVHVAAIGPQVEDRDSRRSVRARGRSRRRRGRSREISMPSSARRSAVATMFERPPSPLTPSVMTGGCCSSRSRSGTRSGAPLLDERALQRQRLGVGNDAEAADLERAALQTWFGVEVLELLLHVGHELVGDGAVDRGDGRSPASGTPSSGSQSRRRRRRAASRSCRRRESPPAAG